MKRILVILLLLAIIIPIAVQASFEVRNDELSFGLIIPDGFQAYDKLAPHSDPATKKYVAGNALYSFNKGGNPAAGNWSGIFLDIERSSSDYYGFDPKELLSAGETLSKEEWQGCVVNVFRNARSYRTGLDEKLITLNAVVPLKPEAIQIKLTGVEGDENEMKDILGSLLRSLEGRAGCNVAKNNLYLIAAFVLLFIFAAIIVKLKESKPFCWFFV